MIDAPYMAARLSLMGRTLLMLPEPSHCRGLALSCLLEAQRRHHAKRIRFTPDPRDIDHMDQTMRWLSLMPADRPVLRKLLEARAVTNPVTNLPLYSWRKIGRMLNIDPRAAQQWHRDALEVFASAVSASLGMKRA